MLYLLNKATEAAMLYLDVTVKEPSKTIINLKKDKPQREEKRESGAAYFLHLLEEQGRRHSPNNLDPDYGRIPDRGEYIFNRR